MKKIELFVILVSLLFILSGCNIQSPNLQTTVAVITAMPTLESLLSIETPGFDPESPTPAEIPTETKDEIEIKKVVQFPDSKEYTWKEFVSGLVRPLGMAAMEDGSGRLLILEQEGVIRVIENGQINPSPFLDIRDRIKILGSEQGLLGIALAPDFIESGNFYLNYTNQKGDSVIARFTAVEDLSSAMSESEQILIIQKQPFKNHNGGNIVFGPDGFLYAGFGDGGSGGDPQKNAQNPETFLGKILRIAVTDQQLYAIPAENPNIDSYGVSEIWALGLRNPWRFSFDRTTGDLYIADVGQGEWEEINYLPAGSPSGVNFGWNIREGNHAYEGTKPDNVEFSDPVTEYGHDKGCSVTGGYVYRGNELPDWEGIYFFGDYCSGTVWGMFQDENSVWQVESLFETGENISSFGEDANGEIYLISYGGKLFKLEKK